MKNECENLSLYITNELRKNEKAQFERHLQTCSHCKQELESLTETWQILSYDVEEIEVPETLKKEVMDFVFEEENEKSILKNSSNYRKYNPLKHLKKHFSPISAGVAILLAISLILLSWSNLQLKNTITALENEEASQAQIMTTYTLVGQHEASSANGTAYILQEGNSTRLVINVNNMPSTKGEEVYQVWLIKNGTRQNAGTLRPDANGNGLITYRLPEGQSFDDIGITLEMNPFHSQPQGQKVMGTS